MAQQQAIHKFVLGNKDLEGKNAEFQYDHGWYSIVDIVGEERKVVYKSRNAQEAYTKWNVYIGRKKERPQREHPANDNYHTENPGEQNRERQVTAENAENRDNHNRQENYNRNHQDKKNRQDKRSNKSQEVGKIAENRKFYGKKKSDAHRQLEKRKAKARREWAERRKAEENA